MFLKSQMRRERADNPAEKTDVASGIIEVMGGGVRPGGGAAIPNTAEEDELCAMVGERRVGRVASVTAVTDFLMVPSRLATRTCPCNITCHTCQRQHIHAHARAMASASTHRVIIEFGGASLHLTLHPNEVVFITTVPDSEFPMPGHTFTRTQADAYY